MRSLLLAGLATLCVSGNAFATPDEEECFFEAVNVIKGEFDPLYVAILPSYNALIPVQNWMADGRIEIIPTLDGYQMIGYGADERVYYDQTVSSIGDGNLMVEMAVPEKQIYEAEITTCSYFPYINEGGGRVRWEYVIHKDSLYPRTGDYADTTTFMDAQHTLKADGTETGSATMSYLTRQMDGPVPRGSAVPYHAVVEAWKGLE